ncbi:MAG: ATP-binding protein [FCB group bacterium]|nr:ATP-binding protein [FCB group bacterium]
MMLKILRASDPLVIDQLVVCIYSNPGLGKTTLGFSANAPLLLDFDKGAGRAASRGDSVQIDTWPEVTGITKDDLAPYQTIVVDTVGRALDILTTDIIRRYPKKGYGGALSLQGYGTLKAEFTAWLKAIRQLGKDVVLIAHSSEDKSGDEIIERLDVQGGSKGEIYKSADAMGRLSLVNGQRVLNFSPTDTTFGKNPAGTQPLNVPDADIAPVFLGGVVDGIKEKINALTDEQQNRQNMIADWAASVEVATTADDFNELVKQVKKADKSVQKTVKGLLHKSAISLGLVYDKGKGGYATEKVEG